MAFTIAVAGKGGTGKTTISALIIKYLLEKKMTPILAVDADANSNLNEVLGVKVINSIGEVREEITKNVNSIPTGMSKDAYLELKIQEILVEASGFDLLAMGRPEGPGCYCYVNNILRRYMDILAKNYSYVVMDNEAGMEHLSRRTTYEVDHLLLISDTSPRAIRAAAKIRDLVKELELKVEETHLIINRVPKEGLSPILKEEIDKLNLNLLGTLPLDEQILEMDLKKRPILELPGGSFAFRAISGLIEKLNF